MALRTRGGTFQRASVSFNGEGGITRLELVVFLAIGMILIVLLIPSTLRTTKGGPLQEDLNNLRNIGQGMMLYMADHEGVFFPSAAIGDEVWPQKLQRQYIRERRTFRSPYDRATPTRPRQGANPEPVSYGINAALFDTVEGKWTTHPGQLILIAPAIDLSAPGEQVKFRDDALSNNHVAIQPAGPSPNLGTHDGRKRINVLFAGGNVETRTWEEFSRTRGKKNATQWDPFVTRGDNFTPSYSF